MLRVFISILIPENVKILIDNELKKIKKNINLKINWVPPENWHFTLIFLGNKNEIEIELIKKSLVNLKNNFLFKEGMNKISFSRIILAPPFSNYKRMIWLTTLNETNNNLAQIKDFLINDLKKQNLFLTEEKKFNAHLTLARFKPTNFKNLPFISREVKISFNFSEIYLIQSILKKPNAEYRKIFKIMI